MENTEKFTGKAEGYAKFRPDYPVVMIHDLVTTNILMEKSVVADIGSGTGILTKQLLDHGLRVIAVEPNDAMRRIAEKQLNDNPKFTSVNGTAEQTTLVSKSIDLITVAQAFHWFDPEKFQTECRRILKPGGQVVLIWNSRIADAPMIQETETICKKFCPNFYGFSGGIEKNPDRFRHFYREGRYDMKHYDHPLHYNLERFIGRHLSASYAPQPADENYKPLIESLTKLFHRYSKNGTVAFPNITWCYSGEI